MRALFMDRLTLYAHHHPWLLAATAAVLLVVIVYEARIHAQSSASVSPQDAIRLMNRGALVIDLRPAEQFAAGHLSGARQMSGEQILKAGDLLKKHKAKPLIVYDDSGSLGTSAVRQLKAQGFTQAFNLRGGVAAWRSESPPLAKG
jgi:rhodanese-related sulfurtransferase